MKLEQIDEEYLISRAKRPSVDTATADEGRSYQNKAWLITARLMFPKNFSVQYEAYLIQKEECNVREAAKTFHQLWSDFSGRNEPKLEAEVDAIVDVLSTPGGREDCFLAKLFHHLPADSQREVLLESVKNLTVKDDVERAKRILLSLRTFPDLIPKHGGQDCLDFLVTLCKQKVRQNGCSELLSLLFCQVTPLLLPVKELHIDQPTCHDLLMLGFEFVFDSIAAAKKKDIIPWSNLTALLADIGVRQGWTILEELLGKKPGLDSIYGQLLAISQGKSGIKPKPNEDVLSQIFYLTTLLFFKSLSEYLGEISDGSILVEAFVTHESNQEMEPLAKRRRTTDDERKIPDVTSGSESEESSIVESFLSSVRYYELLSSDPSLISRLQAQIRPPDKLIMPFFVDFTLYQGRFKEAIQTLRMLPTPESSVGQCRLHLKAASIYHAIGDHQAMAEQTQLALGILMACKPSASPNSASEEATNIDDVAIANSKNVKESRKAKNLTLPTSKLRHIHFLEFNRQSVIAYASRLLVYGLKEKAMQPVAKNDIFIGHMIVLLQYSFPEESDLFFMMLHRIRMADTFTYPSFMHHVIHIEFLEEFSHLMIDNTTNVTLDIAPTFTGVPAASTGTPGRRLGTRGANRGEKNEIRTALRKQVSRCHENLDDIILDFVAKNRDSLFQCML